MAKFFDVMAALAVLVAVECLTVDGHTHYSSDSIRDGSLRLRRMRRSAACSTNPCQNSMPCVVNASSSSGYTCNCSTVVSASFNGVTKTVRQGYKNATCGEDIDECTEYSPCFNDGICRNHMGSWECGCSSSGGYTIRGTFCEIRESPCDTIHAHLGITSLPVCLNNATCSVIPTEPYFRCSCPSAYNGTRCDSDANECHSLSPCKNGATCTNTIGSYNCSCRPNYSGRHCDVDVDECQPTSPCTNGATCVNTVGSYSCSCRPGYQGTHCEGDVNECQSSNPCKNGATCTNTIGSYSCSCLPNYRGRHCDVDVDECQPSSPCTNGATCVNTVGSYNCVCRPGYSGGQCQDDVNECQSSNPCKNGATCTNTFGSFNCSCAEGFSGRNCSCLSSSPPEISLTFGHNKTITSFAQFEVTREMRQVLISNGIQANLSLTVWKIKSTANSGSLLAYIGFASGQSEPKGYMLLMVNPKGNLTVSLWYKASSGTAVKTLNKTFGVVADAKHRKVHIGLSNGASPKLSVVVSGSKQEEVVDSAFAPSTFLANAQILFIGGYPSTAVPNASEVPNELKSMGLVGFRGVFNYSTVVDYALSLSKPTSCSAISPSGHAGILSNAVGACLSSPCKANETCIPDRSSYKCSHCTTIFGVNNRILAITIVTAWIVQRALE